MARKSIKVLLFVIKSCAAIAFQHVRPSCLLLPSHAHTVNGNCQCLGMKAVNPRQFSTHQIPSTHRMPSLKAFVFGVRISPTLVLQSKAAIEGEMHDDTSAPPAQSAVMQEFLSLYRAAIDAGTFIKCTLSANKGEDRLMNETSLLQSTFSCFFLSSLSPLQHFVAGR